MIMPAPVPAIFPYTTLFRSGVLHELGQVVGNVGSIIGSMFSAAGAAGGSWLGILKDITGAMATAFASPDVQDRKSTRLNSSHPSISYAVFCLKKKSNNSVIYLPSLRVKETLPTYNHRT